MFPKALAPLFVFTLSTSFRGDTLAVDTGVQRQVWTGQPQIIYPHTGEFAYESI